MRFITKTVSALVLSALAAKAYSIESFEVKDIEVDGLQRVELGTFFTDLPIRVGEVLDDSRVPNIVRALYRTGNFDFVKLEKEGDSLKVTVVERPVISQIVISGNKVLKTDQLMEGMQNSGIAKGEVLDTFVLEKIEQEISNQYFSNGHYNLKVTKKLSELSRNRVQIQIKIDEGESARIKDINIIGNTVFDDKKLLAQMESSTGGLLSFIMDDNKYSSATLDQDIQAITSYYRDRGYFKFAVENIAVSLDENLQDLYLTLNVTEGDIYNVSEVKFAGNLKIDENIYHGVFPVKANDQFSAGMVTFGEEQIKSMLGIYGYTYAEVITQPEVLEDTNEISLKVFVDPKDKYYVNQIKIAGNDTTDENVFRRELRVIEGQPLSSQSIERSKLRLMRLPFVEEAELDLVQVEGTNKADVNVKIKERAAAQISGSLGYNDFYGLQIQGELSHSNFLGEGKNVGVKVSKNKAIDSLTLSYSEPYFFDDVIGFSASVGYSQTDYEKLGISNVASLDSINVGGRLFYPISEISSLSFGVGWQDSTLKSPLYQNSRELRTEQFFESIGINYPSITTADFSIVSANFSWSADTLNRSIFATNGYNHSLNLEVGTSIGDVEFYKADYDYSQYFPISDTGWIFNTRLKFGFGDGLSNTSSLPYFKSFYSGNSRVRGFENNSIGLKNIRRQSRILNVNNPLPGSGTTPVVLPPEFDTISVDRYRTVGGNAFFSSTLELIFPTPFLEDNSNVRTSFFIEAGNVWDTKFETSEFDGLTFQTEQDQRLLQDFSDPGRYRASVGVSIQWWSPMAPLSFSISKPLRAQEFDETETFSFTIGQLF